MQPVGNQPLTPNDESEPSAVVLGRRVAWPTWPASMHSGLFHFMGFQAIRIPGHPQLFALTFGNLAGPFKTRPDPWGESTQRPCCIFVTTSVPRGRLVEDCDLRQSQPPLATVLRL